MSQNQNVKITKEDVEFITAKVKEVFGVSKETVESLYFRWVDESEFEDFGDYDRVFRNAVSGVSGVEFVKSTKRPFGFQFRVRGVVCQMSGNSNGLTAKVL